MKRAVVLKQSFVTLMTLLVIAGGIWQAGCLPGSRIGWTFGQPRILQNDCPVQFFGPEREGGRRKEMTVGM